MRYLVKTPWLVRRFWSSYLWKIDTKEKEMYLTFDDGPHPVATPFVLDVLKQYNAKATFFCIGKNVLAHPDIYRRILEEGHQVGNHTQHHVNGWKTENEVYLKDVMEAAKYIDSPLFRPPYGRIRRFQAKYIRKALHKDNSRIVMWSVLSGDFDTSLTKEDCMLNVTKHAGVGDIIVFHDSEKAFPRLEFALPIVMENFADRGFVFKRLTAL